MTNSPVLVSRLKPMLLATWLMGHLNPIAHSPAGAQIKAGRRFLDLSRKNSSYGGATWQSNNPRRLERHHER